jgi:hypothetical protein
MCGERARLVKRLKELSPPEDWQRTAVHEEYSRYSVMIMFRQLLTHEMLHAYRIEELSLKKRLGVRPCWRDGRHRMTIEFEPKPASTQSHDQFEVVADGLGRYTIDYRCHLAMIGRMRAFPWSSPSTQLVVRHCSGRAARRVCKLRGHAYRLRSS